MGSDPFTSEAAAGFRVRSGEHGLPREIHCDVAIVGSGAGGGVSAEMLTRAGLDVVIVEEGPLRTSRDFKLREREAYSALYQDGAARATKDQAINILQGRCVGGGTVVNWTTSFRTPSATLEFWRQRFGLTELTEASMEPWFAQAERRFSITPWEVAPNKNNELLRKGAQSIGLHAAVIARNVKQCANLGACGLGCPTNAKQSMLVTTLPTALEAGARLFCQTRVERIEHAHGRAQALVCEAVRISGDVIQGAGMRVIARHVVVAGGAINSPGLLLRSDAPDPHSRLGKRTFLHPVTMSAGVFEEEVMGWVGAPQSIYVDDFMRTADPSGPIGYKLEAQPIYPALLSVLMGGYGPRLAERMRALPHTHVLLALLRDGFHEQSQGGCVYLAHDGTARLDYPLTPYVLDGARRALLTMVEVQFAAGARKVLPFHELAEPYQNLAAARAALTHMRMDPLFVPIGSAHVMGGCGMSVDEQRGVVRPDGVHWQLENVSVHDGSIFPTSIGTNPQVSIYSMAARWSAALAKQLTGREVSLA